MIASRLRSLLLLATAALVLVGAFGATADAAEFQASKYPATVHGSGKLGVFKLWTNGGDIECQNTFHSNLSSASSTLRIAVTFSECKAFGFVNATVKTEGCEYVMHATEKVAADEYLAHLDLDCPAGKSLKVSVFACEAEYKTQTGMTTVRLNDETGALPVEDITFLPEVTGVKYTVTKDGSLCPLNGTGEKTDGEIVSVEPITLTAQNPSNASEKIGFWVE